MKTLFSAILSLSLILLSTVSASGLNLYVSPSGNDGNPGTEAQPFLTLVKARDAIRDLKANIGGLPPGGVTVVLRDGVYPITSTIELTAADSGSGGAPIVYRSAPGEVAKFYGGEVIPRSAFVPVTDAAVLNRIISVPARAGLLVCDLDALGITDYGELRRHGFQTGNPIPPLQLYVDGRHQTRARYPNEGDGFMTIHSVIDAGPKLGDADFNTRGGAFVCSDSRPGLWADVTDSWINGVLSRDWAWTYTRIAAYEPETRRVTMATGDPYGLINSNREFFFAENILEEIDQPGEYYMDRISGKLYVLPPADFDTADIGVSVLSTPMVNLSAAEHITFRGIQFMSSRDGAVSATGNYLRFEACEIGGMGRYAFSVNGYHNAIVSCDIHDIGGSVISLRGGDFDSLTPSENIVDNCYIHRWGDWMRVYNPGVSLWDVGQVVRHSWFEDFPHDAIEVRGNDHLIEYNEFMDGMKDFKDLGVIYANLGMNPHHRGTVIRRNFFNGVASTLDGQHVVYADNGTMDWLIEENVFFRVGNGGSNGGNAVFSNGGSYVVTRNNVFVDCSSPYDLSFFLASWAAGNVPSYEARWEEVMATYNNFESMPHATKYPGLPLLLEEDRILPDTNVYEMNLVWNPVVARDYPESFKVRGGDPALLQTQHNHIAASDPGFVDWQSGDFSLREDAPVFSDIPGFQAPPFAEMGLRDEVVGIPATPEILRGLPPTDVLSVSAILNAEWVRAWGSDFEIEVFWGESDEGTDAAAWSNRVSLGVINNQNSATLSHSIAGLNSGVAHFYRFRATNSLETIWMESTESFYTLGPAAVDTASGSTAESSSSATLRGRLTIGSTAEAWIYWGRSDAGQEDPNLWEHAIQVGSVEQGQVFSHLVTGLESGRSYWYRCYASNGFGGGWSDAATFQSDDLRVLGEWTPAEVAPGAWFDASDTSTLTSSSGAVNQWRDKRGNGPNLNRSTAVNQPKTGTRTINGLNVLDYDGDDSMAAGFSLDCTSISVFIVREWDDTSGISDKSFSLTQAALPFYSISEEAHGGAALEVGYDNVSNPAPAGVAVGSSLEPGVLSYVKTGTSQKAWLDGIGEEGNTNALESFSVGLIYGGSSGYDGAIGEMIVIRSAVSEADRQKIEGYLAHKWDLAAKLPANHPYKAFGPSGGAIVNQAPNPIYTTSATLNAKISVAVANPVVTAYWGEMDGGTNAGGWTHQAVVDPQDMVNGDVSFRIDGLSTGSQYAFTFRFQSSEEDAWAQPSYVFTTSANTYAKWIASHEVTGALSVIAADYDGDGIANGLENYFGTDPTRASRGMEILATDHQARTFKFTHPKNANPASEIVGRYRWSTDLVNWHTSGETLNGSTITFQTRTLENGDAEVTATESGDSLNKLFIILEIVTAP